MASFKSIEQHYTDVLSVATPLAARRVPIHEARSLVLAEDVHARIPIPPFTNSAMDGFAVRAKDVTPGTTLRVQADVPAGAAPSLTLEPHGAIRIMTGAPLPAGADSVLKVEDTVGGQAENMLTSPPPNFLPSRLLRLKGSKLEALCVS
ncbi:MAG: hypothetical protein SPI14_05375 [Arcanobacterium sp.]|nr:hypothetical protein [Arcanobacterium sp.]